MNLKFSENLIKKPLFLLYLILPILLNAQENNIRFQHMTIEDGLSQNTIFCMLQGKKGFMWFGTEDGLNKYDGYQFKVYSPDPENPNSLSSNYIYIIYQDRSGVLWVGTRGGGLNKFDRKKEKFTRFQYNADNPNSLSHNIVYSIYEDRSGVLWIGTEGGGLNKFDRKKEKFTRFQYNADNPHSLSSNYVYAIYEDHKGTLWIGTANGLNRFNRSTEQFMHCQKDAKNSNSLSHNRVMSIYEDQSGTLWIGTDGGGLNKLVQNEKEGSPSTFIQYFHNPEDPTSLSNNRIYSIYEDRSGFLWVGTEGGGLNKFIREKGIFIRYQTNLNDPTSLNNNRIYSIYEDRSGVLWVGTRGGGLNKFDREAKKFTHYQTNPNDPNSLSHNSIWSIYEDTYESGSILWIGTLEGLNRFDRKKEKLTCFQHNPNIPDSLSHNYVRSICEDQLGMLWIGTDGGGLNRFDHDKEKFIRFQHNPNDPNSLSHNTIRPIYKDRQGILWIGTFGGGLNRFDHDKEKFIHFQHNPDDPNSLSHNYVYSIYEDREGVLWIGTDGGGLNRFERDEEKFIRFQHNPHDPNSLSHNTVYSIYEDRSGVFWIGTRGGGLNRFDRAKEIFLHYSEKNGLPNNTIYGILEDNQGNIWLSTNKGISRFNPNTEEFKNYDTSDGLQSNEFNGGAYYKSQSGEIFFGGINGLNSFYPDNIKENPYVPPVVITDFQISNKSIPIGKNKEGRLILKKSIMETEEIILSYKDRALSFEFAALHYASPEKNNYAYMMKGFEKDWNVIGNRRFATYTNLPPGNYIFKVIGSNNDGVWNEEGVSLKILVTPPFWGTWWFRTLFFCIIIFLIVSIHMIRTRFIIKRTEELERIDKLSRIARRGAMIAHEINNPLFAIANSIQVIKKRTGSSSKEIKDVVELTENEITRLRKIIKDFTKMKLDPFEKSEIMKILNSSIKVLRWGKKIRKTNISIVTKNKTFPIFCNPESLQQVFMNIILNSIESMKGKGKLTIDIVSKKGIYEMHFMDTGPGFSKAIREKLYEPFSSMKHGKGTGLGLFISYNIIKKHNGEIILDEKYSGGAHVIVKIPRKGVSPDD